MCCAVKTQRKLDIDIKKIQFFDHVTRKGASEYNGDDNCQNKWNEKENDNSGQSKYMSGKTPTYEMIVIRRADVYGDSRSTSASMVHILTITC
uniref:Uncharacterized protein n=1 Tax=Arion vulgaris TaxID=1028688 RepID=A0A0B7A8E9_9EUPU